MGIGGLSTSAVLWTASAVFGVASACAQTPHTHQHRFDDAHKWSQVFDDPARDAWQKPREVLVQEHDFLPHQYFLVFSPDR